MIEITKSGVVEECEGQYNSIILEHFQVVIYPFVADNMTYASK